MGTKWAATHVGRTIAGLTLSATLIGGVAACGSGEGTAVGGGTSGDQTGQTDEAAVVSAAEGAAARGRFDQFRQAGSAGAAGAESMMVADTDGTSTLECGPIEPYVPTPDEIAAANADTDALAAVFDTYGVAYERITDDVGFAYLQWDNFDAVAQSVHDSYWADRYPVEPPDPADLDRAKAENDVVARYLDEAGISYNRVTDAAGWEQLQYDYEDPAAMEAVNAAYAELYPQQPPSDDELASIKADNDKLAAAFDAAGVSYTRVSDELGWEWLEWDWEDPDTQSAVDAVFSELYPPIDDPCLVTDTFSTGAVVDGEAAESRSAEGSVDGAAGDMMIDPGLEPVELTPEQVAQRDRDVAALIDGFDASGVSYEVWGESPWDYVRFDFANPASVTVVADVLAARS